MTSESKLDEHLNSARRVSSDDLGKEHDEAIKELRVSPSAEILNSSQSDETASTSNNSNNNNMNFPQRLMQVLEDEENQDIIRWHPHGLSFKVHKKEAFEQTVLPRYFFKQSKYWSFTRKLGRWGFTRTTSGPESGSYSHPLFKQGQHHLLARMSCQSYGTKFAQQKSEIPQSRLDESNHSAASARVLVLDSSSSVGEVKSGAASPVAPSNSPSFPAVLSHLLSPRAQLEQEIQLQQQTRQQLPSAAELLTLKAAIEAEAESIRQRTLLDEKRKLLLQGLQHKQQQEAENLTRLLVENPMLRARLLQQHPDLLRQHQENSVRTELSLLRELEALRASSPLSSTNSSLKRSHLSSTLGSAISLNSTDEISLLKKMAKEQADDELRSLLLNLHQGQQQKQPTTSQDLSWLLR